MSRPSARSREGLSHFGRGEIIRVKQLFRALFFTMMVVLVQSTTVLGIDITWIGPWEVTVSETPPQGNASQKQFVEVGGSSATLAAEVIAPPGVAESSGHITLAVRRTFTTDGCHLQVCGRLNGKTFAGVSVNGQLITSVLGDQASVSSGARIVLPGGAPPINLGSWAFTASNGQTINVSESKVLELTLPAGTYIVEGGLIVSARSTLTGSAAALFFGGAVDLNISSSDPAIAPVANAGPDQTVRPGTSVTLDGSGSFDPQALTPLDFAWTMMTEPGGSAATLIGANTSMPSFTPDIPGEYRIQLVVTNSLGTRSDPDVVVVSTVNSAPVAAAGPDQVVTRHGTTIQLDGLQSFDPDGDTPLRFAWTMLQKPATSTATLPNSTSPTPTFVADVQGDYVLRLVVTDPFGAMSDPDTVLVSFNNVPPVANAGATQTAQVDATVVLDGSGSSDANGDPLTFRWSLVSKPATSLASLATAIPEAPRFVADEPGTYIISLVVHDGFVDSAPSSVTIMAISTQTQLSQSLGESIDILNALAPAAFKNASMQKTTSNKLVAVLGQIEQGLLQEALDKLENDVLAKMDGCAKGGAPDKNDWITNCSAQAQVYPLIVEAIGLLESLL